MCSEKYTKKFIEDVCREYGNLENYRKDLTGDFYGETVREEEHQDLALRMLGDKKTMVRFENGSALHFRSETVRGSMEDIYDDTSFR